MAVSPSSQCYQAARRHLRPHYDSIWVPDSLLASAFERYAATFRTGARYGSSVPGPMEHRKRLAKRHMGELHFGQSHSAAPIWELAGAVDLTQWKWTPPTPSDARSRQNVNTTEPRTLSHAALSFLRPLSSPHTDAADDRHKLGQKPLPPDVILNGVAEPLPPLSWDANSTPLNVIDAALDSLSWDKWDGVGSLFSKFCESWQQALAEGLFHGEAIGKVLMGITERLSVESVDAYGSRTVDRLKLLLLDATIEGISKRGTDKTTSFDHVAWSSILHAVSTIRMNTIRVFTKAVACVPEPSLKAVSPGILENLDAFFNALGRATTGRPTLVRQTAKMAVPMKSLGEPELRFVLDDATKKVLEYRSVDGVNYSDVRFSWLLLLARLPGVDEEYLAQACMALEAGPAAEPLTDSEICQLLLVWAHSQAPLDQYAELCEVSKYDNMKSYFVLGVLLWKTRQFYRARHFSKFLYAIGRETRIGLLAKGASHFRRSGPARLIPMALGMGKPRAAIDIFCLYEESQRCKSPFWQSQFGFRALKILTWVPNFDHRKLWKSLKIIPGQQLEALIQRRRLKGIGQNEIPKIAAVGIVTGLSPHLTHRKAVSLMMNCYLNLQRHNTKLPRSFLRALIHNTARHLIDGQPGISSRLRYILYIIQQQAGQEEAQRIATAMQELRKSNLDKYLHEMDPDRSGVARLNPR
ncbi:hypothetical protein F4824DRAFT_120550 [Ustulina deusta]|nr:hypothetical protein F4824DRAFT_120550 [Ustulina deusta]